MPGLGPMVILLLANVIWFLLNLFASWALKLSGEGANTISWGKMFHALIVRAGRSVDTHLSWLLVCGTSRCDGSLSFQLHSSSFLSCDIWW